ncbi:CgeB family protein [Negadavirga shengliensis]|uniref:Glycosyltransferase n=1 Tax=Negadavirga shengliensis TaxID=1389218 RepID=A0ABV9T616_9BACT
MKIVIIGLSITSSWGNGHATTYRSLVKALTSLGHSVLFLEFNTPFYAANRDLPHPSFCELGVYDSFKSLQSDFSSNVQNADLVIVGSYVHDGIQVGEWVQRLAQGVVAFYDIDTPVTLARLKSGNCDYLSPALIPKYDLYLSFSGGPILDELEDKWKSPNAKPLYCSVDIDMYYPLSLEKKWLMGYMGTYSPDRQPPLDKLLIKPAETLPASKFVVAGPKFPSEVDFPANVETIEHLPPHRHCEFYNSQRFTLNLTRSDMIAAGYSPSVRLFEAAACGTPVISDTWNGLDSFFTPNQEILLVEDTEDILVYLQDLLPEEAVKIGKNARKKILKHHTSQIRASELVLYTKEIINR